MNKSLFLSTVVHFTCYIYSTVAPLTNLSFKHENRKYMVHALEVRQSYSMLANTKFPKLIYWDSLTLPG